MKKGHIGLAVIGLLAWAERFWRRRRPLLGPLGVPVGATGGMNDAPDISPETARAVTATILRAARGPSLFAHGLLADEATMQLRQTILNGIAASDMPSFKGQLDDAQIGRLLAFCASAAARWQPHRPCPIPPTG